MDAVVDQEHPGREVQALSEHCLTAWKWNQVTSDEIKLQCPIISKKNKEQQRCHSVQN